MESHFIRVRALRHVFKNKCTPQNQETYSSYSFLKRTFERNVCKKSSLGRITTVIRFVQKLLNASKEPICRSLQSPVFNNNGLSTRPMQTTRIMKTAERQILLSKKNPTLIFQGYLYEFHQNNTGEGKGMAEALCVSDGLLSNGSFLASLSYFLWFLFSNSPVCPASVVAGQCPHHPRCCGRTKTRLMWNAYKNDCFHTKRRTNRDQIQIVRRGHVCTKMHASHNASLR